MADIRQQLLAAKKLIEEKSGQKFSYEYLALADLISEFVAIKVQDLKPVEPKPMTQSVGKPSDDLLYGIS